MSVLQDFSKFFSVPDSASCLLICSSSPNSFFSFYFLFSYDCHSLNIWAMTECTLFYHIILILILYQDCMEFSSTLDSLNWIESWQLAPFHSWFSDVISWLFPDFQHLPASQHCREGLAGHGWWKTQCEPAVCSQKATPILEGSKKCDQQVRGSDSAPLLCSHLYLWTVQCTVPVFPK